MNLLLQDPFSVLKEYPEKLTHTIQNPLITTCLQFSPGGHYLALGSVNGSVMIFDMDTRRPMHVLGAEIGGAHSRAVQSIQWSNNDDDEIGRYIVTSGRDWYVKVWDIRTPGAPIYQLQFDGPIWSCQWVGSAKETSIKDKLVATVFEEQDAYYIDPIQGMKWPLRPSLNDDSMAVDNETEDQGYVLTSKVHPMLPNVVITGSSKGWIEFYEINGDNENPKFALLHSEKISNSNVKDIIISNNGDRIAINCSDRTIRQYTLTYSESQFTLTPEHKYQDVINKLQWNGIVFSNKSGDYLVASTHGSSTHELYLWETTSGSLVRVLEGAEEELMDIDWNYQSMTIASNGFETGDVYIWSLVIPPKWSALAPDFEEVEENVDYREKEDEFDDLDDEEQERLQRQQAQALAAEQNLIRLDLRTREKFDVRGNELLFDQCPVPIDYDRIIALNHSNNNHNNI